MNIAPPQRNIDNNAAVNYHRSKSGAWAKCSAKARPCPLGGTHLSERQYTALSTPLSTIEAAPTYSEQPHRQLVHVPDSLADISVAPSNYSGVACPKCHRYLPLRFNHEDNMAICAHCGHLDYIQHFDISLQASEAKYLDDSQVAQAHWFHVSHKPNWAEDVRGGGREKLIGGIFVHLGSREAAMDRLRDLRDPRFDEEGDYYLHEVRLKQGTDLSPNIYLDKDDWPARCIDVYGKANYAGFSGSGVTRYVNTFEAPGTMSLIATGDCFEVVASNFLPF